MIQSCIFEVTCQLFFIITVNDQYIGKSKWNCCEFGKLFCIDIEMLVFQISDTYIRGKPFAGIVESDKLSGSDEFNIFLDHICSLSVLKYENKMERNLIFPSYSI